MQEIDNVNGTNLDSRRRGDVEETLCLSRWGSLSYVSRHCSSVTRFREGKVGLGHDHRYRKSWSERTTKNRTKQTFI